MTTNQTDLTYWLTSLKIAVAASVLFASLVAGVAWISRDHKHSAINDKLSDIEKTQMRILAEQHAVLARQQIMLQTMRGPSNNKSFMGEELSIPKRKGL